MRSRNQGILSSALTGDLNLELAYYAPDFGMPEVLDCRSADIAPVEIGATLEDVAFLLCKN
jgi:hypothetical protein